MEGEPKMRKRTLREQFYRGGTPMRWHCFLLYVLLPLQILMWLISIPAVFTQQEYLRWTEFEWISEFNGVCTVVILCVLLAAELGLACRAWLGPCAIVAAQGALVISCAVNIIAGVVLGMGDVFIRATAGQLLGAALFGVLNWIYYRKRRALFLLEEDGGRQGPDMETDAAAGLPERGGSYYFAPPPVQAAGAAVAAEERRVCGPLDAPERGARRGAPVWLAAALGVLCLGLAAGCGILGWQSAGAAAERESLAAENARLADRVERLEAAAGVYERKLTAYGNTVDRLEEENRRLSDLERVYYLYKNSIGYLVEGSQFYHTAECAVFLSADAYWAYNKENCARLGYSPCPLCWGK